MKQYTEDVAYVCVCVCVCVGGVDLRRDISLIPVLE